jgi:hypothetical protein
MRERTYADGSIIFDDTGDWVMGSGAAFPPASIVPPDCAPFWRTDLCQWCHYHEGAWSVDQTPAGRLILPMGEIDYFDTTGTAVAIASQSDGATNLVEVAPVTALSAASHEFEQSANGRLRYTGAVTRMFHIACSWSFVAATAGDVFVLVVSKSGTPSTTGKVIQTGAGTNNNGNANHVMLELATGDYLSLFVGNLTAGRNATFKTVNLFAMGM